MLETCGADFAGPPAFSKGDFAQRSKRMLMQSLCLFNLPELMALNHEAMFCLGPTSSYGVRILGTNPWKGFNEVFMVKTQKMENLVRKK
jgi:hypothetical protein